MPAFWRDPAGFTIGNESAQAPVAPPDMMRFRYTGKNFQVSFSGQPYKDMALTAQDIPIDGAFPDGMGQELQARSSATKFKALTLSGASGANLFLGGTLTIDAANVQDRSIAMGAVIAYPHVQTVYTEYQTTPGPILMRFDRAGGTATGGLNLAEDAQIAELRFRGQTAGAGTWTNLAYIQTKWRADYGGFIEMGAGTAPATDAAGARLLVTQNLGLGFFTSTGAFPFLVDQTANVRVGLGTLAPTATAGFLWVPQATGLLTAAPSPNHFGWKPLSFVGNEIYTWDGTRWKNIVSAQFTGEWRWSSLISGPVGDGYLRVGNVEMADATDLVINNETNDGTDVTFVLSNMVPGDQIYFQDKDDATNWARYELTSVGVLVDDDYGFFVTNLGHNGSIANNQATTVRLISGGGGGGGTGSGVTDPGGEVPQVQYKLNATTFGGVGNSSVTGANVQFGGNLSTVDNPAAITREWLVNASAGDVTVRMTQAAESANPILMDFRRSQAASTLADDTVIGRLVFQGKIADVMTPLGFVQARYFAAYGGVVDIGAGIPGQSRVQITQAASGGSVTLFGGTTNYFQVQTAGFQFSHGITGSIYYKDASSYFVSLDLVDPADEGKVLTAVRVPATTGVLIPQWAAGAAGGPSLGGVNGELLYRVSPTAIGSVTGSVVSASDITLTGALTFSRVGAYSQMSFQRTNAGGADVGHAEAVGAISFQGQRGTMTQMGSMYGYWDSTLGYVLALAAYNGTAAGLHLRDNPGVASSVTMIAAGGTHFMQVQQGGLRFSTGVSGAIWYQGPTGFPIVQALAIDATGTKFLKSDGSFPVWATVGVADITGTLPTSKGGTGRTDATIGDGFVLIGNGAGYNLAQLAGGGGITVTYPTPGNILITQAATVIAAAGDASQLQYRNPSTGNLAALPGSAVDTSHVVLGGNLTFNRVGAYAGGYSVVQFNRENASGASIGHGEVVGTLAFSGRLAADPSPLTQLGYMESYYDTTFGGVLRLGALLGGNTRLVLADNGTLSSVSLVASNGLVTIQAQQGGIFFGTSAAVTDGALYYRASGGALTGLANTGGGYLKSGAVNTVPTWGGILAAELPTVPVSKGGTGRTDTPGNGFVLIGDGTGYALNQLVGAGGITITYPTIGNITITQAAGTATIPETPFGSLQYNKAGTFGAVPFSVVSPLTGDLSLGGDVAIKRTDIYGLLAFERENAGGTVVTDGQPVGALSFRGRTATGAGGMTQLAAIYSYWSAFYGGGLRMTSMDGGRARIDIQDNGSTLYSASLFVTGRSIEVMQGGIYITGIAGSATEGALYYRDAGGFLGGLANSGGGFLKSGAATTVPTWGGILAAELPTVPTTKGGTGRTDATPGSGFLLIGDGAGYNLAQMTGAGGITITYPSAGHIQINQAAGTATIPELPYNTLQFNKVGTFGAVTASVVTGADIELGGNLTFNRSASYGVVQFNRENAGGASVGHAQVVGTVAFSGRFAPSPAAQTQLGYMESYWDSTFGGVLRMGALSGGNARLVLADNGTLSSVSMVAANGVTSIQTQQGGIFFVTPAATGNGALYYRASDGALTGLPGSAGFLKWNGSLPAYSAITVADWTGIVPVTQGGLGASTSPTVGYILRANSTTTYQPVNIIGTGGTTVSFTGGQIVVDSATTSGGPSLGGANNELVYRSSPTALLTVTGSIVASPDISLAGNLTFLKPSTTFRTLAFYHTSATDLAHGEHVGDILFKGKVSGVADTQVALITAFYQTSPAVGLCLRMGGGAGFSRIDLVDDSTGSVNSATLVAANGSFTIQAQQTGIFFGTSAATTTGALYYRASGGALTGLDGGTGFLRTSGSGTVPSWNLVNLSTDTAATALPTAKGGTGRTDASIANGSILTGNGAGYSLLASSAGFLKSTGAAATLAFVGLTVGDWTGIVPTAQGGLGASGSGTQGQVPRIEASGTAYAPATLVQGTNVTIAHDYSLDTITISASGTGGPTLGGTNNEIVYRTSPTAISTVPGFSVSSSDITLSGHETISRTGVYAGVTGLLRFHYENTSAADITNGQLAGKVEFYGKRTSQQLLGFVSGIWATGNIGMLRLAAKDAANTWIDVQDNGSGTGSITLYGGNGAHQLVVNNIGIDLIGPSGSATQGAVYHQDASGYVGALQSNPGVLQSSATNALPTWGALNLASATYVTGVLAIGSIPTITVVKGGTNLTSGLTATPSATGAEVLMAASSSTWQVGTIKASGTCSLTYAGGNLTVVGAAGGGLTMPAGSSELLYRNAGAIGVIASSSYSGTAVSFGCDVTITQANTVSDFNLTRTGSNLVDTPAGVITFTGPTSAGGASTFMGQIRGLHESSNGGPTLDMGMSGTVRLQFGSTTGTLMASGYSVQVQSGGIALSAGTNGYVYFKNASGFLTTGVNSTIQITDGTTIKLTGGSTGNYFEANTNYFGTVFNATGATSMHATHYWILNYSGTAANGMGFRNSYRLPSSTTQGNDAVFMDVRWQNATHAARSAVMSLRTTHKGQTTPTERMILGGYKDLTRGTATDLFTITFNAADQVAGGGEIHMIVVAKQVGTLMTMVYRRKFSFIYGHNGTTNTSMFQMIEMQNNRVSASPSGALTQWQHCINSDTLVDTGTGTIPAAPNSIATNVITYKMAVDSTNITTMAQLSCFYHIIMHGETNIDLTLAA